MDKTKKSNSRKGILLCLILFCSIIYGMSVFAGYPSIQMKHYLNKNDSDKAAKMYNEKFAGTSEEEQYEKLLLDYIEETRSGWQKDKLTYKEAAAVLNELTAVNNKAVSSEAERISEFIMVEGQGDECYAIAEGYYKEEEYLKAMKELYKIDEVYLQYAKATKLKELCTEAILEVTKSPDSVKEYEAHIKKLEAYYEEVPETAFLVRKAQLEQEVTVFKEVVVVLKDAADAYEKGDYQGAFDALEAGVNKYPENMKMSAGYETYHNQYVAKIKAEAETLCEAESYKEALKIVETSIKVHDCEELQELLEYVKEEKSILYRFKNSIEDFFGLFK